MLVSSTSMNVASVTAIAMIQGLIAGRGRAAPSAVRAAELIWPSHLTQTLGSTDIPGRRICSLVSPGSNVIFTGMRCTTFT